MSHQSTEVQRRPQAKDKTTPRPWHVHEGECGDCCILTANDVTVAVMDCENADADVNIADADLIVQAVNERERLMFAHDKLYVACRTAFDLLQNISSESFAIGGDRSVRDVLSEAIDQAELNGIRTRKEREA